MKDAARLPQRNLRNRQVIEAPYPCPLRRGNGADRRCVIIRTVSNPSTGCWPRDTARFVDYLQCRLSGRSAPNKLIEVINGYGRQRSCDGAVTQCQLCGSADLRMFLSNSPRVAQQQASVRQQGLGRQPGQHSRSGHRRVQPGKVGGSPHPAPVGVLGALNLRRLNSQQVDAVFRLMASREGTLG